MKINKVKIFFTSIDVIEDELSKINEDSKQNARDKGVISKYSLNFEGFLALEYNPLDMKAIFWQPINKDYTMMLSNLIDGWQTLGYILNKVKGIQITKQHTPKIDYWFDFSEKEIRDDRTSVVEGAKRGTDVYAIFHDYISITPLQINQFNEKYYREVKKKLK